MPELSALTWPEVAAADQDTLLVPLGSTEQHGPHLPLDVDTRIAHAVAHRAAAADPTLHVAPAFAYGSSGEHQAFEGTISIGTDALTVVLVELARSALQQWRHIIFVNGHGGNLPGVRHAVDTLRGESRSADVWYPTVGGDAHAGAMETSVMLHLAADQVRQSEVGEGNQTPLDQLLPDLIADGLRPHTPTGVLGDPRSATADHGRILMDQMVQSLGRLVHQMRAPSAAPQSTEAE